MEPKNREMNLKIFQTIRTNLGFIGLTPNQQQRDRPKLNSRQIVFVLTTAFDSASNLCYFFAESVGNEDYMDIAFYLTLEAGVLIAFISLIFKKDKGFRTIELCEKELSYSKFEVSISGMCDNKF